MYRVLPEWNGWAVGAMHRIGMTKNTLALEMGIRRQYVSRVLNSKRNTESAKRKVENAIRSFCEENEIDYEQIKSPFEERQSESADP